MTNASGSKLFRVGQIGDGNNPEDQIYEGLPAFTVEGFLPAGIYRVDHWESFAERFGWNAHRRSVLNRLCDLVWVLGEARCRVLDVGGSFVSSKGEPRAFDAVWSHRAPLGSVDFEKFRGHDLLHLLNTPQAERPKFWGGNIWMDGETARLLGQFVDPIDAFELLRQNRLVSPVVQVGLVRLNPLAIVERR